MKTKLYSLLAIFALILSANIVNAQQEYLANTISSLGDGDNPYVGTEYTYSVTSPSGGAIKWLVYSNDDLTGLVAPGAGTYTVSGGTTSTATITWNSESTFYLTYEETLVGCITRRGVIVVAKANTFDLVMEGDVPAVCNVKADKVLDWDNYDTELVKTTVDYVVNMTKDAGFNIQSWEFKGVLTLPSDLTIADAGDISITGAGSLSVLGGVDNKEFTIKGIPSTETSITISVAISSLVYKGGAAPLAISLGKALSGPTSSIITNNLASGSQSQLNTLKLLPAATNISF